MDEEEVSYNEELTQVNVLMALADDELTVGNNRARNGEWIDITMRKVNILLSMDEDADWKNYLKYINIDLNEQIPNQKKKIIRGELLTESSSKKDENENLFIPTSIGYDHEMVPKSKDWVERHNPDSKLSNFNTGRILVLEKYLTPLPPLKTFRELHQALRFTNTLVDKIGIDDSSRYAPDEYHHEDDPSRQYQSNSNISYYIIPHGRSLTELTQEEHVPEVISSNEQDNPHNEVVKGPPNPTNTEGIQEQNVQDEQIRN
ncbi:hypothetical protein Tco_1353411 [Tanacetum coccineum]